MRASSSDLDGPRRSRPRARSSRSASYDGVHLGHHAVLRLVRELADAQRPRRRVRHLRPPPGRGRAAGVGAEAAHHPRAEARAARRDRLPRPRASCCTSTRRAAASRPRSSCARCSSTARRARLVVVGADFHFGHGPRRQRRPARAHGRRARLRGARPRARGARPAARSTRRPGSASCSPTATSPARPRCSAARTRCAGVVERGRPARAASSASRPPTSRCPTRICLPADGIYAGTFAGRDGVERPAAISLGRRPTFYERRRAVAARGLRARLRRRPLRRQAPRSASCERLRGEERFELGRRPGGADAARRRGHPACSSELSGSVGPWQHRRLVIRHAAGPRPVRPTSTFRTKTRFYSAHARHHRHDLRAPSPRHRHRFDRRCRSRCSPSGSTTSPST